MRTPNGIDLVYRPDGNLILSHTGDEDGGLSCEAPRWKGPGPNVPENFNPPACPACVDLLIGVANEWYNYALGLEEGNGEDDES